MWSEMDTTIANSGIKFELIVLGSGGLYFSLPATANTLFIAQNFLVPVFQPDKQQLLIQNNENKTQQRKDSPNFF